MHQISAATQLDKSNATVEIMNMLATHPETIAGELVAQTIVMADSLHQSLWQIVNSPDFPVYVDKETKHPPKFISQASTRVASGWQSEMNEIPVELIVERCDTTILNSLEPGKVYFEVPDRNMSGAEPTKSRYRIQPWHNGTKISHQLGFGQAEEIPRLLRSLRMPSGAALYRQFGTIVATREPDWRFSAFRYSRLPNCVIGQTDEQTGIHASIYSTLRSSTEGGRQQIERFFDAEIGSLLRFATKVSQVNDEQPQLLMLNFEYLIPEPTEMSDSNIPLTETSIRQFGRVGEILLKKVAKLKGQQ